MGRIAILIANSTYDSSSYPNLDFVSIDIEKIKRVFEIYGSFTCIQVISDQTSEEIKKNVELRLSSLYSDDDVFIYFSGHGDVLDNHLRFIAKNTDKSILRTTSIGADFFVGCLRNCKAKTKSLIIDCCFSGAFSSGIMKSYLHNDLYVNSEGVFIITSSRESQVSYMGNEYSLFTEFFVKGIETKEADSDKDGIITLDEIYNYIYKNIDKKKQNPTRHYDGEGNIYIATYQINGADNNTQINESIQEYLNSFIKEYREKTILDRYIDLRVINTSTYNGTKFNANIGIVKNSNGDRFWILENDQINQLVDMGCASFISKTNLVKIEWNVLIEKAHSYNNLKESQENEQERQRNDIYKTFQNVLKDTKKEYADYVSKRIKSESSHIKELLMINPPFYPEEVTSLIYPKVLPKNLCRIWKRFLREAMNTKLDEYNTASLPPIAYLISEIAETYTETNEQNMINKLFLISMELFSHSIENFLNNDYENLYILLGDYGAGKTTMLQKLMFDLSLKKITNWTNTSLRIPIILNLREYNKTLNFDSLIQSFLKDEIGLEKISSPFLRELNSNGRLVLLLDGFDEMMERVTKPDRRRCFVELSKYIRTNAKIILTGRPGYFPDQNELAETLQAMNEHSKDSILPPSNYSVNCLQLMNDDEVENYINKSSSEFIEIARDLIYSSSALCDLARRPVLTNMILGSAIELSKRTDKNISARDLFSVYTYKWVQREEDKGKFRLLINPDKKSTFLRFLAMQMHITGKLSIPYKNLGKYIEDYFDLKEIDKIDYFSNDIRTCSFLARSDTGEYSFVHKSFMEFFVAQEFEKMESSPFINKFAKPLTPEMVEFLDFNIKPIKIIKNIHDLAVSGLIERIHASKDESINNQNFEQAAYWREIERNLSPVVSELFYTMDLQKQLLQYKELFESILKSLPEEPENVRSSVKEKVISILADISS